jgi:hypothetical protein
MMLGSVAAVVVAIEVAGLKRVYSRIPKNGGVEEDIGKANNIGDDTEFVADHTSSLVLRTISKNKECVSVSTWIHLGCYLTYCAGMAEADHVCGMGMGAVGTGSEGESC